MTEEEQYVNKCKKHRDTVYVLKCKCKKLYEVSDKIKGITCNCGKQVFNNHKPYTRNCTVLWKREG